MIIIILLWLVIKTRTQLLIPFHSSFHRTCTSSFLINKNNENDCDIWLKWLEMLNFFVAVWLLARFPGVPGTLYMLYVIFSSYRRIHSTTAGTPNPHPNQPTRTSERSRNISARAILAVAQARHPQRLTTPSSLKTIASNLQRDTSDNRKIGDTTNNRTATWVM